jgi:FMN reductase
MERKLKVVGLGGSLASHSTSLAALRIALDGAAAAGAETELLDVRALALPLYSPEERDVPDSARLLADKIHAADALIWSTPMYHGTVSGSFKNALDWLQLLNHRTPPFLTDKVIGLLSTAGGVQGLQAINTMEYVVRALRGLPVPLVVAVSQAWKAFDERGNALNPELERHLRGLGSEVVRLTQKSNPERDTVLA